MWLDNVKILLVDDHEPNLIALEQVLENPLLDIHKASSGQEGLEMMLTNEYAIVLLDVNMPEMDGFEVARLMKSSKRTCNLPISFVTAINKEKKYAVQGYEIGAVDYLYKPLDPEVIKSKVSVFVELFRLRKESENRLNVIQSSIDGIAILNTAMRFVSVNDALINMLGYKEETDLEGELYQFILDDASQTKFAEEIIPQLKDTGKWQGEIDYQHKDKPLFPVGLSLNQTNNGVICIARDISERKIIENKLKGVNKELETFTYITSHDMRSPLVNIKGFCGELEEAIETLNPAIDAGMKTLFGEDLVKAQKAKETYLPSALKYINLGTQKLDSITGLLLELSRTGRRALNFEMLDMNELIQTSLDYFTHQIQQGNIDINIQILPNVVGDHASLAQIISNLLDNAIKYLDPSRTGYISISGKTGLTETTYSINDNGRGIPKNQIHKVFEVFRRVGDVEHIAGEGMGMAFIKTLLSRHEGQIWCESEVDKGTTFFFSIGHGLKTQSITY